MKSLVETQLWDSSFFGYKVGKCDLSGTDEEEISYTLKSSMTEGYRLIYFFLNRGNSCLESVLENFPQLKLVDTKREYERKILASDQRIVTSGRCVSQGNESLPELQDLALQSGLHSRFHGDANFVNQEFERLYIEWIKRSLSREIADEVFAHMIDGRARGLVTLARKSLGAEIGLIAVDCEKRSLGIGSDLIRSAIKKAWEWNSPVITVTTQRANSTACKFYEKHGFSLQRETNIYHMWNMDQKDL